MTPKDIQSSLALLQHGRSAYYLQRRTQLEDLELRLKETAAWCAHHIDLANIRGCFRPLEIAPHPLFANRWSAVEDIVRLRRYKLGPTGTDAPDGRLMLWFPDEELTDGAAAVASRGFFDDHNAPPWGTWVGYFEDRGTGLSGRTYLLAWVPTSLIESARAGIRVNPEVCIEWLANAEIYLRSIMQAVAPHWVL
jgi:hypothetical protein